jgi:hypothetical protein
MPTIAVDFDGVIHAYSRGWADGTIYDPPLPGALTGIRALMEHAAVFIHTTRDPHQVVQWLQEQAIPAIADSPVTAREFWNERSQVLVSSRKYPAVAYLDDRAVRFHSWDNAVDETLLAAGLHPAPATVDTAATREAEQRRRAETADAVAAQTKKLLERRTATLRERAERDGAYRERAHLVALVAGGLAEQAVVAPAADIDEPGWQILYATLHGRQCSWHFAPRDADLIEYFEHVPADDPRAQWDGHTTEAKYDHIDYLARGLGTPGQFAKR